MVVTCWIQQVTTRVGAVTCWIQQPVSPKQVVESTCLFNPEVDQSIHCKEIHSSAQLEQELKETLKLREESEAELKTLRDSNLSLERDLLNNQVQHSQKI